jgi:antitoxin component of RelBE/YafQ-DinJ toxin-antitoxin module
MIEKELFFHYKINYKYLFDITTDNNSEIIKIIDDLKDYKQGIWKGNKRKDLIEFTVHDIPEAFKLLASAIIVDNNLPLKIKFKLIENNDKTIKMKIKANLLNKMANLILKFINLKIIATIDNIDNYSSNVKIKYIIKTILPSSIVELINTYIENKLNNNFIKKIDNYLKNLRI